MNYLKDKKKLKIYYFLTSLFFAVIFSSFFINLALVNINLNGLLNYPTNTGIATHQTHDITMIFSWARRAAQNFSIFNLGSNLSGVENNYHHFSSRGLGLYLLGLPTYLFEDPINVICFIFIICSLLNFYLILIYFKNYKYLTSLFLTCLTILFASKVFGGVLNPFHYYEYFFRELENFQIFNSLQHSIYTALYRVPNILINNIVIFLCFYSIKKFGGKLFELNTLYIFILITLSTIIDPLIFIVMSLFFFLNISFEFFKKNLSRKTYVILIIFLFLVSCSLIFHYHNALIAFSGNEKHGTGLGNFWTGNPLFSIEMIIFPIILYLFLYKEEKQNYKVELIFLISLLITYLAIFQINEIAASRITNRNFEIIIASISYLFLFRFFKNFDKRKKIILFIFLFLHIPYVYLFAGKIIFQEYIIFFITLFILIICIYLLLISRKNQTILNIISIFFIAIFFISIFLKNSSQRIQIEEDEIMQQKFFDWVSQIDVEKNLISLNLGLILNSELHTNHNVYISNITNVPSHIDRSFLMKRLNDIFYLYGFTISDLNIFLKDYITQWEINLDNFTPHKKNLAILNKIIFYENFQNDYKKNQPISILLENYKNYLKKDKKFDDKFNLCVITKYDEKYIKNNSYFSKIQQRKPIYLNSFIKAYEC